MAGWVEPPALTPGASGRDARGQVLQHSCCAPVQDGAADGAQAVAVQLQAAQVGTHAAQQRRQRAEAVVGQVQLLQPACAQPTAQGVGGRGGARATEDA